MKLLFLGSGSRVPSCRFRVMQLVPHLRAAGHTCTIANSFPQKYDYLPWLGFRPSQKLKRLVRYGHLLRARLGRYDAIIVERELFHDASWDLERRFRRAARTLVLDVDDAVFLNFPEKFPHLVRLADLVFAGNRLLAEWLQPTARRVEIMPTCVDIEFFRPRREPARGGRPVIGWIGTAGNVAYLHEVADVLSRLAGEFDFELRVIAGGRGVLDDLPLNGVRVQFTPWDPAREAEEIAAFDIGLMPLRDDQWSRYKCGLKLLQYMACGVAGVASPVGVNEDIIQSRVNGFLCRTADEWYDALSELLRDVSLRERLGAAARRTVEQHYSFEANVPRWLAAVEAAVQRAKEPETSRLTKPNG